MIFNKKEIKSPLSDDSYIVVDKKDVDRALRHTDYNKFTQIFQDIPIGSVLYAVSEKNRLAHLIRKQDLKFIDTIFDFFDKNKDANYQVFNSQYVKSTDKEFAFKIQENPIEFQFKTNNNNARNAEIRKFKNTVMAKIFHYKENTESNFISQSLDMLKKHDLTDNFIIRKFSSIVLLSNFEANHNQVIKHNLFADKRIKKEYLSYVFQASTKVENLNIIMKDFEENIREIFFEKLDNNDFWFDFKVTREKPPEGIPSVYSVRPWEENTNKLIWLEKNHMGFSHVDTPYYIEFLKFFDLAELEDFLTKVDKDKYLNLFNRAIIDYQQLSDEMKHQYVSNIDTKTFLLRELKHKEWDSSLNFYEILKKGLLHSELETTLELKQTPKKVNKV